MTKMAKNTLAILASPGSKPDDGTTDPRVKSTIEMIASNEIIRWARDSSARNSAAFCFGTCLNNFTFFILMPFVEYIINLAYRACGLMSNWPVGSLDVRVPIFYN